MAEVDKIKTVDGDISIRDIIARAGYWRRYFASRWKLIVTAALVCAGIGLSYAFIKKPVYTAESSFALEDNQDGLGQYTGLATAMGISLGGHTSGLFEGDNII